MFVTFEELQEATGYLSQAKVRAWLDKYNIPYMLGREDKPVVLKTAFEQKDVDSEPDFSQVA